MQQIGENLKKAKNIYLNSVIPNQNLLLHICMRASTERDIRPVGLHLACQTM